MKTTEELIKSQDSINAAVLLLKDPATGATAKVDGIIDIEEYCKAKTRITWVLKEVNSSGDGEEWNMLDTIKDWAGEPIPNEWRNTFDNILYATNGILTQTVWGNQDKSSEITHQLSKIAYCNVKKVPGAASTNMKTLEKYYQAGNKHVLEQINAFEPEVIIFGNTYDILEPDLDIMHYKTVKYSSFDAYFDEKQIIINAYHPANTKFTNEVYCNDIIQAVIDLRQNR